MNVHEAKTHFSRLLEQAHADDDRLSKLARELIGHESPEVFASAASALEIATKQRLGKLDDVPRRVLGLSR